MTDLGPRVQKNHWHFHVVHFHVVQGVPKKLVKCLKEFSNVFGDGAIGAFGMSMKTGEVLSC